VTSHPQPASTRSERLDRLPFTRRHQRLLIGSGVGWALDAMDVGLISFVMAALAVQWKLNPTELSWLGSIGFVGMALGAAFGGLLADRIGRRSVFAATLLVYGLATGASALAGSLAALIVLRFVVGLGLGAELPVASTLVSEYAPTRIRGRVVVALEAFWAVGWFLAALIGYFVVPRGADGWRWALALGALPALYAVVVRVGLPESVRFLESRGRHAEAEEAVRAFERSAEGAVAHEPAVETGPTKTTAVEHPRMAELWTPRLRRRTAGLWGVWFGLNFAYYGAFIWLPTLFVASGMSLVRSFGYTLVITAAQLPGYAVAAFLIEKWGRRSTLATFLLGAGVAAGLFAAASTKGTVLAAGMLLSFFALGAWGGVYAVTPEVYPTPVRGTGAGWAAGFGRIASIIAPLSVPLLRDAGGTALVFATFAAAFALAAAAALALPETRGIPLAD
jgi:putative MFS transporter